MTLEEAIEWLKGERSMANFWRSQRHMQGREEVYLSHDDAAQTQQAYWIARAHKEGLVGDGLVEDEVEEDVDRLIEILIDRHGGKLIYSGNRREFEITAWLLVAEWRKWG